MGFRGFADLIIFSCGFAVLAKSAEHGFCCFLTTVFGETTDYHRGFRFCPDFRFLFIRKQ